MHIYENIYIIVLVRALNALLTRQKCNKSYKENNENKKF